MENLIEDKTDSLVSKILDLPIEKAETHIRNIMSLAPVGKLKHYLTKIPFKEILINIGLPLTVGGLLYKISKVDEDLAIGILSGLRSYYTTKMGLLQQQQEAEKFRWEREKELTRRQEEAEKFRWAEELKQKRWEAEQAGKQRQTEIEQAEKTMKFLKETYPKTFHTFPEFVEAYKIAYGEPPIREVAIPKGIPPVGVSKELVPYETKRMFLPPEEPEKETKPVIKGITIKSGEIGILYDETGKIVETIEGKDKPAPLQKAIVKPGETLITIDPETEKITKRITIPAIPKTKKEEKPPPTPITRALSESLLLEKSKKASNIPPVLRDFFIKAEKYPNYIYQKNVQEWLDKKLPKITKKITKEDIYTILGKPKPKTSLKLGLFEKDFQSAMEVYRRKLRTKEQIYNDLMRLYPERKSEIKTRLNALK